MICSFVVDSLKNNSVYYKEKPFYVPQSKILGPEKIVAIKKYIRREDSLNHIATLLYVSCQSIKQLQTYQSLGLNRPA